MIAVHMILWLPAILYIVGLVLVSKAFARTRSKALIFFLLFFALGLIETTVSNLHTARALPMKAEVISTEEMNRREQMAKDLDEVYAEYSDMTMPRLERQIHFPLGLLLLVIGTWVMLREKRKTEPEPGEVRETSSRPSG